MTRQEALEIFGLQGNADAETIRRRYRELALQFHSDHGGNDGEMAGLNEARDALLGDIDRALITLDGSELATVIASALEAARAPNKKSEARAEAERETQRLVRLTTSPLKFQRRRAVSMAGFAAALATVSAGLKPLLGSNVPDPYSQILLLTFGIMGIVLGLLAWLFDTRLKWTEALIHEVSDALSEPAFLLDLLQSLIGVEDLASGWSKHELVYALEWRARNNLGATASRAHGLAPLLFSAARRRRDERGDVIDLATQRAGPSEIARLILAKCREHGLIEENRITDEDGAQAIVISLSDPN